jgi:lipoprotein-anchoring transpeptidase ErfK/SrfK
MRWTNAALRFKRRGRRVWVPAACAVIGAVSLAACTSNRSGAPAALTTSAASTASSSSASSTSNSPALSPSTSAGSSVAAGKPVHIKLLEDDTYSVPQYGVGMPIVAYFSAKITEARDFSKATTVKVNGQPNAGHWYFETSAIIKGYPIEAHYRPARATGSTNPYWPAHADIRLAMNTKGVSAGPGLVFNDSLSLHMSTGAAHISRINCGTEQMVVTSDGKTVKTYPVSCGAAKTATFTGVKVVMQKGEQAPGSSSALRPQGAVEMIGTGTDHYDLIVPWSVRITGSGEYIHAASWNGGNIGRRSTSNGCTNLNTAAAQWFYGFAQVGDVATYTDTGGSPMPYWDGFGDWNLPDGQWDTGGLVPTV